MNTDLEGKIIEGMSAASKHPFRNAFLASLGLGLSRLVLFAIFLGIVGVFVKLVF